MDIDEISILKERIKELEKEKANEIWSAYKRKCVEFLNSIVGKCFKISEGSFRVYFRISGYEESYFIDKQGMYGQWGPERFYKI